MAATGCMKINRILPFDAPRYVSSDAQTVTCVPDGRTGYSITEVRFSICDLSTEKGEQVEYGSVVFNAEDNCWEREGTSRFRSRRTPAGPGQERYLSTTPLTTLTSSTGEST